MNAARTDILIAIIAIAAIYFTTDAFADNRIGPIVTETNEIDFRC